MSEELDKTLTFVLNLLRDYGLNDFYLELSTKDPEKFVSSDEAWEKATETLRQVAEKQNLELVADPGGASATAREDLRPGQRGPAPRAHLPDVDHPARLQPCRSAPTLEYTAAEDGVPRLPPGSDPGQRTASAPSSGFLRRCSSSTTRARCHPGSLRPTRSASRYGTRTCQTLPEVRVPRHVARVLRADVDSSDRTGCDDADRARTRPRRPPLMIIFSDEDMHGATVSPPSRAGKRGGERPGPLVLAPRKIGECGSEKTQGIARSEQVRAGKDSSPRHKRP
ncbi:threonine--tRNA ligase [Streptomyces violaceorubidus]